MPPVTVRCSYLPENFRQRLTSVAKQTFRFAFGEAETPAVTVDDNGDVI
jgi:hypothetical protein